MICTDFNSYELKERNDPFSSQGKLYEGDKNWVGIWVEERQVD